VKRVLIVDDEKSFLLSLKDGLSIHSEIFQVLTAENGREAVSVLRALPVDLLVTDLKMPEMDGFELLAWVSRHQPQLPVIVLTAFGTPEIEARLAKMTTLQFLEKPLDFQLLQERIFTGLKSDDKSYIRGVTLPTFLQLMHLEQKTCTLKVTSNGRIGYLYIRRGELLDAEFEHQTGETAALDIVGWDNTEIEMDGVCRSQQRQITMTLEHILIDAFRLKDERMYAEMTLQAVAPETSPAAVAKVPEDFSGVVDNNVERRPISAEKLARKRLGDVLTKLPPILEYAIFDQKSFLADKNSGACTLEEFDPAIYTHLIDMVNGQLNFGSFNCLVLSTASRSRYLLFSSQEYRVVAKLKTGIQMNQVIKEIKGYINR
jgi:DNA-binding response OmpR family regulator